MSLAGYIPWSCKELDMAKWLHFSPLMNLLQFLHMLFWGSGWSRFYLFHAFLDTLLWNCLGLMAQWVCGVFIVELSGCGLSITESLCVSQLECSALPSLFILFKTWTLCQGFPGGSGIKNLPAVQETAGDSGPSPGLGRSPGEGHDNPLQYSCLENSMNRETWWATVHGVSKIRSRLSVRIHIHY